MEPPEVGEQLNPPKQMDTFEQYLILMESQVYLWQVPGWRQCLLWYNFAELNVYRE